MKHSPRPARLLSALPALAVLAALLAGCSSGPAVLAKVGERTITVEDFLDVARRNQGQYAGAPDSAKAALLEDLVKRELLVGEARKRGLIAADEQARMLKQAEEQLALRALVQRLAPRDVPVSDAEVQTLYQRRASESHMLVVFTPDRAAIDQALAEIQRGADFSDVADRFNTTGMTPRRGDLGFQAPGSLLPALDTPMSDGPVGKVLGPIESPGDGWFLVKLLERRKRQQEPFEQVREQLRQGLQQGKQRVLLSRVQNDLLTQYHVRIQPGAGQVLFARYNAPKDTMPVGGARLAVPAAPTPAEARQVLVQFDGADGKPGGYTLGDAVRDLQDPSRVRPNFSILPMIDQWLKNMVLGRVAVIEAGRRRLGQEPAIARQARAQVDNALLRAAYETLVLTTTTVGEDDIRAAFQRRAAQLVGKDGVPLEYAKLEPGVKQMLEAEALELRREQKLKELTDALRLQSKPVIHRERLAKIPWPVPPEEPAK
jgi:peptidyl-prolyl cis-trans isomerase C